MGLGRRSKLYPVPDLQEAYESLIMGLPFVTYISKVLFHAAKFQVVFLLENMKNVGC